MAVKSVLQLSDLATGRRLDPEYYQPLYLADLKALQKCETEALGSIAYITDGIHNSPDEVEEGGIKYLSAKCVRNNDFALGAILQISDAQHSANPRTSLQVSDVLLTTVGTIGNASVVQPDLLPANADRHLGIIRINKDSGFDPYFVAAFLNSEFGRFQSLREATGNVQLNLFIEKMKILRIPKLVCADIVSNLIKQSYVARLAAMEKVVEAERQVSCLLKTGNVDLRPSKTYSVMLSGLFDGCRFGSEFYMPAKARAFSVLQQSSHRPLSDYVKNVKETWNPRNTTAEKVRNFDLSEAMEPFLDDRVSPTAPKQIGSSKKRIRSGDVVISRLRSYLRQIAVVRCSEDPWAVGSSEFVVLRPTGDLQAETLLAFLRSEIVQTILQWSQDGTNHPRFDEATLLSIPVPDIVIENQAMISKSIESSIGARQEMMSLLREADALINNEMKNRF